MSTIEQIKAEIERLKGNMDGRDPLAPNQKAGYLFAIADILSFLSTIESEKPMDLEELEKEAVNYCFDNGLNLSPRVATDFAHHFAQWVAEHLKK